jgi:transcriptional regulator with XRE-family HTH domain
MRGAVITRVSDPPASRSRLRPPTRAARPVESRKPSAGRSRACAQRQLSLAELGEALGRYLGRTWSRQAVHQAERGQRSFTAAELTALALVLDTSVQALFRAEDGQIELPGRVISLEEYRGTLLNRENDGPLDGLEELIIALHDIGEILERPALARMARIARAAEQVTW